MSKSSYKVMKQIALGVIVSCGLSGVSHAQSNSTTEMYYIFDIKTTASAQEVGGGYWLLHKRVDKVDISKRLNAMGLFG